MQRGDPFIHGGEIATKRIEGRIVSESKTWVAKLRAVEYRTRPETWIAEFLKTIPGDEGAADSKTEKSPASKTPESPCPSNTAFRFQILHCRESNKKKAHENHSLHWWPPYLSFCFT